MGSCCPTLSSAAADERMGHGAPCGSGYNRTFRSGYIATFLGELDGIKVGIFREKTSSLEKVGLWAD